MSACSKIFVSAKGPMEGCGALRPNRTVRIAIVIAGSTVKRVAVLATVVVGYQVESIIVTKSRLDAALVMR